MNYTYHMWEGPTRDGKTSRVYARTGASGGRRYSVSRGKRGTEHPLAWIYGYDWRDVRDMHSWWSTYLPPTRKWDEHAQEWVACLPKEQTPTHEYHVWDGPETNGYAERVYRHTGPGIAPRYMLITEKSDVHAYPSCTWKFPLHKDGVRKLRPWWCSSMPPSHKWDRATKGWVAYENDVPPKPQGFVTRELETFDATDEYAAFNAAQHAAHGRTRAGGKRQTIDRTRVQERLDYYKRTMLAMPVCSQHGATVALEALVSYPTKYQALTTIRLRCTECEKQA